MRFFGYLSRRYKTYRLRAYLASKNVDVRGREIVVFGNPIIEMDDSSEMILGDRTYFFNCKVSLKRGSRLVLGNATSIKGSQVSLDRGADLSTGENVFLEQVESYRQKITLSGAKVSIGAGSRVRASVGAKQDAQLKIGQQTYINQGTEIRCHSSVSIGDYVLISYEVDIFDNNTHSTDWQSRRRSIESSPVGSFMELTPPATKPISIGSNCWIGKRAAILKGVAIGDRSIVALSSVVTKAVPEDCLAYGNPANWKKSLKDGSLQSSDTANPSSSEFFTIENSCLVSPILDTANP